MNHDEKIKKVKSVLKDHGIKMKIGGCGCCGSPWVVFEFNGEKIESEDNFTFNMFEDE